MKVHLTPKQKQILVNARAYIVMTLGLTIYAFAWVAIITPAEFIGGGIPGVSNLIVEATGGFVEMGPCYFVINVILVLIALKIIGPTFGIKTIYAMLYISLALFLLPKFVSPDFVGLRNDKLLSAILGGALCGLGIGICFTQGGSTGGTDIIAMIVNKYHNVSLGKVIMLCDVIIIGCSFFVYHKIATIIYGYVTLGLTGYTIDAVLQGNRQSCQLLVISKNYTEIADSIVSNAHRGVTVLDGSGWYTKNPQKVLMIFCRRNESTSIYRIIKEKDPDAFISNASISGVYGNGFENLKLKQKQKS